MTKDPKKVGNRIRVWGLGFRVYGLRGLGLRVDTGLRTISATWRFMVSYKWSYKSPSIGYSYSYPTCNPTYN